MAGLFGLAIVLVVLGVVVALYSSTNKAKQAKETPDAEQESPFAELPPELPPVRPAPKSK